MKKIFKILGIICIVILVLVGGIFSYSKIKQITMNNERKNSKTLMEYVRTHSWKYVENSDKTMDFVGENLKCKVLNDTKKEDIKGVVGGNDNLYIFLNDNSYISLSIDNEKLYSNNQNCQKNSLDIDTKDIKIMNNDVYIISKDNKVYKANNDVKFYFEEIVRDEYVDKYLLLNDDIKSIISLNSHNAIVLKKDNSLYRQKYGSNYNSGKVTYFTKNEEIFVSNSEYGNILNATAEYNLSENSIEFKLNTLLTDKGYYYYGEVKTDKCTKYEDIECEKKILESEIYKKFSKDIKYIGKEYTILNNNSIIETKYLTYPLDKDLK